MVHNNPTMLNCFIKQLLQYQGSVVFIHVDEKGLNIIPDIIEDPRVIIIPEHYKIQLDEAENTPEGEAVPGQMACRAGKSSFVVNWQGEMRSCVVLDKPSIPLRDVEFEEAWEFTKKEGPVDKVKKKYLLYGKIYVIILP